MQSSSSGPENRTLSIALPDNELRQSAQGSVAPGVFSAQRCVHEFFEMQAARRPDAIAAVFNRETLSYGELNARANCLAERLKHLGVHAGTLVAICVEPSLALAVGLLGILKSGGAYVPLDPSYPKERLTAMLSDAQPFVIASQKKLAGQLSGFGRNLIAIDESAADGNGAGEKQSGSCGAALDQLAYVVFTSGSTGKPKGVLVSHGSLANHATAMADYYGLAPSDRVLQFASLSFDVAAEEIFPSWLSGASVVFWPQVFRAVPIKTFLSFVEQQQITVLNLPTPYWVEWVLELDQVGIPPSLRLVIVGSEKVPGKMFSIWQEKVGERVRWCNAYGPTEATITATVYEPGPNSNATATDTVPIGKAIANVNVFVLDENLNPVPPGTAGELYIGGAGVAQGYLNRPELTAEKFVRNPFENGTGGRLYRTGDLVRRLDNCEIEFLGRADDQVKIRGYRIELGEVEAALRQHPSIANAIVITREDAAGRPALIAYLVARANPAPSPAELARFLRDYLPEPMLPGGFVFMKRMPLTPSGKVDRAALPAPKTRPRDAAADLALPRDSIERELVRLWEKILGVKPVGIRDNFFDMGGHSLLVLRLITQIERTLDISLPVSALQQAPTIEQLALIARQRKEGLPRGSRVLAAQTAGSRAPIFLYGGTVQLAHYLGPDQPAYLLEFHGLDGWRSPATIEEMARESIASIREIQPHGPYFLAGYSFGGLVIYEIAQRLKQEGEEIGLLVLIDPTTPNISLAGENSSDPSPPEHPCEEFVYHWRNLARLNLRGKFDYVALRVCGRARMLKIVMKRGVCEALLERGHRLPAFARMFYFMELSANAIQRYVPLPYSGQVIVLRRAENGTGEEWRHLAAYGMEMHEIDAPGHLEIIQEPYVNDLGGKLKYFLDAAQGSIIRSEVCGVVDHRSNGD